MSYTTTFEELEFAGAMAIRFLELDFTDYDGTETFDENDAGMSRIQHVDFETIDGSGFRVDWNESTGELQVFDGATEATTAGGVSPVVRAKVTGRQ